MSRWEPIGGLPVTYVRGFYNKYGHVVQRAPFEWVALYDGVFIAVAGTPNEARDAVESAARTHGWAA